MGVSAAVALGVLSALFSLPAALMVLARAEPAPVQWFYVSQVLLLLVSTLVATFFLLWALDSMQCSGARPGMLLCAAARGFLWFLLLFVALAGAVRLTAAALGIVDFFIFGLFKQYLTAKAFSVAVPATVSGSLAFLFFATAAALHHLAVTPPQSGASPGGSSCPCPGAAIIAALIVAANVGCLLIEPNIPSLRLATEGVATLRRLADSPKLTNGEVPLRSFNTAAVDALCIKALSSSAAGGGAAEDRGDAVRLRGSDRRYPRVPLSAARHPRAGHRERAASLGGFPEAGLDERSVGGGLVVLGGTGGHGPGRSRAASKEECLPPG
jgi:hypothetical protein